MHTEGLDNSGILTLRIRHLHSICDCSCRRKVSVRRCSCCICCMRSRCRARFCGMGYRWQPYRKRSGTPPCAADDEHVVVEVAHGGALDAGHLRRQALQDLVGDARADLLLGRLLALRVALGAAGRRVVEVGGRHRHLEHAVVVDQRQRVHVLPLAALRVVARGHRLQAVLVVRVDGRARRHVHVAVLQAHRLHVAQDFGRRFQVVPLVLLGLVDADVFEARAEVPVAADAVQDILDAGEAEGVLARGQVAHLLPGVAIGVVALHRLGEARLHGTGHVDVGLRGGDGVAVQVVVDVRQVDPAVLVDEVAHALAQVVPSFRHASHHHDDVHVLAEARLKGRHVGRPELHIRGLEVLEADGVALHRLRHQPEAGLVGAHQRLRLHHPGQVGGLDLRQPQEPEQLLEVAASLLRVLLHPLHHGLEQHLLGVHSDLRVGQPVAHQVKGQRVELLVLDDLVEVAADHVGGPESQLVQGVHVREAVHRHAVGQAQLLLQELATEILQLQQEESSSETTKHSSGWRTDLWAENSQLWTLPLAAPLLKASVTSQNKPCFRCSFCRRDSSEQWEEEDEDAVQSSDFHKLIGFIPVTAGKRENKDQRC
ncbi:hypothetical protein EYF80_003827 [Liparis tanakae]|uniref:Uncharacterized protein n=1 Tax=Liparis tanakae TaxID=230148 RepID=A0A4Z2J8J3_9TELE|nr:hypothetical protein EYF80_003827 [Liparis tanakae]